METLDNKLKFLAEKYVYIRSWPLGLMKYTTMIAILFYVVVYNILYTCEHLAPNRAIGFGMIDMQHPVDNCNDYDADCHAKFHNIAKLPYCTQYEDDRRLEETDEKKADAAPKIAHPAGHGLTVGGDTASMNSAEELKREAHASAPEITTPKSCRYLDRHRLQWTSPMPSDIFIPTRYNQIKQKVNPDCYNPEQHSAADLSSGKKYRCKQPWTTETEKEFFVADIEQFELKLSHSFNAPEAGLYGVSSDFQGLMAACTTNHPTNIHAECKRAKIPGSKGDIAPEDDEGTISAEELGAPNLRAESDGTDVITLSNFLKLTPVAQNNPHVAKNVLDTKFPAKFGHKDNSLREVGGMIMLDVNYMNTGYSRPGIPFLPEQYQIKPITYRYRPYFLPSEHNTQYQLVQQSDDSTERIVDIWYGITITMQFNGELVGFSWSELLTALTTGLVLLSMASTVVVYAASFVMADNEKYNALMYQVSESMSDARKHRSKYVTGLGRIINPLGLLESKEWKEQAVVSAGAQQCKDSLQIDGTPNPSITNAQVVKLLCMMECRLARLDAMDTRVMGADNTDPQTMKNRVYKAWCQSKSEYFGFDSGVQ